MTNRPNDLSAIFRSLGPRATSAQASPVAAAQAAEQRWPLLKALAPRSPAPPPALSDEDKARWGTPDPANRPEKKPALSMPGLGDKLTKSLGKMGGRLTAPPPSPVPPVVHEVPVEIPVRAGLLTKPLPEPAVRPEVHVTVTDGDDSLASIFNRLATVDEPQASPAPRKSSFLSRIGKR